MLKKTFAYVFTIFGLSASVFAQSAQPANGSVDKFAEADALFAARDTTIESIQAAREAYKALAVGAADAELVRAIEGVARTYLYEGEVLTGKTTANEKKARKNLFNECWKKAIEPISPKELGTESPVYYYWKASCMAREAEVSNALERLVNLPTLLDTFSKGLETDGGAIYEGGGLERVKAAIKGNIEAKGLPGGLYNPDEALQLIEDAIAAEAYPGNTEGFLFCENYFRKATILSTIGRGEEAKDIATTTITDFTSYLADGLIPETIRVETSHCMSLVEELLETL